MSFIEKYNQARKMNNSYVCVGLDSDINKIPKFLLEKEDPIFEFNKAIIDATKDKVVAYKPNYAFYISAGLKGLEALKKTIEYIPDYIPCILDVKTGDIGNTMAAYAEGYFSYLNVDSITINPLMGENVIDPLRKYSDKYFFTLALTSNKSASDFILQNKLYENISEKITEWGPQFGAVVGATQDSEIRKLRGLMPNAIFLIPGIGAQGGDIAKAVTSAKAEGEDPKFVINSSRGIIFASSDESFAEVAAEKTEILRKEINKHLVF